MQVIHSERAVTYNIVFTDDGHLQRRDFMQAQSAMKGKHYYTGSLFNQASVRSGGDPSACDPQVDTDKIPSMSDLLEQHASLKAVKKIGEGTFGEAFKAKDVVFKIVPLEGDLIVNGETQKRSEEISAEAAISFTLSNLRGNTGLTPSTRRNPNPTPSAESGALLRN